MAIRTLLLLLIFSGVGCNSPSSSPDSGRPGEDEPPLPGYLTDLSAVVVEFDADTKELRIDAPPGTVVNAESNPKVYVVQIQEETLQVKSTFSSVLQVPGKIVASIDVDPDGSFSAVIQLESLSPIILTLSADSSAAYVSGTESSPNSVLFEPEKDTSLKPISPAGLTTNEATDVATGEESNRSLAEKDILAIVAQIEKIREEKQMMLKDITAGVCSDCVCRFEKWDTTECSDVLDEAYSKLGYESAPRTPWGGFYGMNQNEGEGGPGGPCWCDVIMAYDPEAKEVLIYNIPTFNECAEMKPYGDVSSTCGTLGSTTAKGYLDQYQFDWP